MAAAEPRTVTVAWTRVAGWIERYDGRHAGTTWRVGPDSVSADSPDGSCAWFALPFPPVSDRSIPGVGAHLGQPWQIGLLIVRKGGFAVARAVGAETVDSKVGRRRVQGRAKAGGWSQQRFARRRDKQAREAYQAAAGYAKRMLLPHAGQLDLFVTAGDRAAVDAALASRDLAILRDLPQRDMPGVPEPTRQVLDCVLTAVRSVEVRVHDALR
jgi:hypothetical protein